MNNNTIARLITYAALICVLGFITSACKTGTDASSGSCKQNLSVHKIQTLHANDTGNARFFYLETTPAKSSCEAHYSFYFRWANQDSFVNSENRPPLDDLTHNFTPGGLAGLVSYFPHPVEVHNFTNLWTIDFSIGDKNSSSDTTTYTVTATLKNGTLLKDSVDIDCKIDFSGVAK